MRPPEQFADMNHEICGIALSIYLSLEQVKEESSIVREADGSFSIEGSADLEEAAKALSVRWHIWILVLKMFKISIFCAIEF